WLLDTRKLRRILEHERPTLIELGSSLLVPAVTRWASRGLDIPTVWFYHTHLPRIVNPAGSHGPVWRRIVEQLAWWHVRRTAAASSATFAASETIAAELERHGVHSVRRVRLGVDLDRFHPDRRIRTAELRRRMQLPAGPLAVFAGRFTPEKQLETVLAAWDQVRARTGAALVLLGHGPIEPSLRSRFSQDGIFWRSFETDRSRVADLLAAADCYIAPGPSETFGLSALEALASGTPVLSVDTGGTAELVANSGAGRLYQLGDVAGCVAQAVELLGGAAASLRIQARAYAESRHAWPVVLADLLDQYRGVLSAPSLAVR
ncbi:MAG: glycosyltransferase, partial [Gemmatimonadota bacterium]